MDSNTPNREVELIQEICAELPGLQIEDVNTVLECVRCLLFKKRKKPNRRCFPLRISTIEEINARVRDLLTDR